MRYTHTVDAKISIMVKFATKISSSTRSLLKLSRQLKVSDAKAWVSASQLKNYAIGNTLEDYLDLYYDNQLPLNNTNAASGSGHTTTTTTSSLADYSLQKLFKLGYTFEDKVVASLTTMFPNSVTILSSNEFYHNSSSGSNDNVATTPSSGNSSTTTTTTTGSNSPTKDTDDDDVRLLKIAAAWPQTVEAIKAGKQCIFQAPLLNDDNNTFGIADIIIRSDCLSRLLMTSNQPISGLRSDTGLDMKKPYYSVIDIKYSHLDLCCDGLRIRNSELFPAYKCQLAVYNAALAKIQGYEPERAYVIGKSYSYTAQGQTFSGNNCFDKLGVVEFEAWDAEYKTKVKDGLNWLSKLRSRGHKWKLYPKPSNSYLLPNMKINKLSRWQTFKTDYAKQVKDITLLWYCGLDKRQKALEAGIMALDDPKLTSAMMGFGSDSKIGKQLQLILNINRPTCSDKIIIHQSKRAVSNLLPTVHIWPKNKLYFSIDFETLMSSSLVSSSLLSSSLTEGNLDVNIKGVTSVDKEYLFMVGVCSSITGYKCFVLEELTIAAQQQLLKDVYNYLRAETDEYLGPNKDIPELYHWSNFEPSFLERLCRNYGCQSTLLSCPGWSDLMTVFHDRQIVIKDCYSYSLKSVVTALCKHGLIAHCWDTSNPCSNGNVAMNLADIYYHGVFNDDSSSSSNFPYTKDQIMEFIRDYNYIDCQALIDILVLLQSQLPHERDA